jgi:DNA-directed RNA polymerase specialized sigma24 family protein
MGGLARRVDANTKRWRRHLKELRELGQMLREDRWSEACVAGLEVANREKLQAAEATIAELTSRAAGRHPAGTTPRSTRPSGGRLLLAHLHRAIALTIEALMREVAGRLFDDPEAARRAMCGAYLDVWRVAPILHSLFATAWSDGALDERASIVLSSWFATRTKRTTPAGGRSELEAALTEDGAPFWPTLLERLPRAVAIAWSEFRRDGKTPAPGALLNRAIRLLADEGRSRRVRTKDGGDRYVSPEAPPGGSEGPASDGGIEALELRLEAEEAVRALGLTAREAAFWALDRDGYTNREIAETMGVGIGTVGPTLARVRKKILRLRSQLERPDRESNEKSDRTM